MANASAQPRKRTYNVPVAAVAQGSDGATVLFITPFDGTIESVKYTTATAITGADTNTRKTSLMNKGGVDGTGTTALAELQYNSGISTVAFVPKAITLNVTPANLNVAAGDVISWASTKVSTGIADPGGMVTVVLKNR